MLSPTITWSNTLIPNCLPKLIILLVKKTSAVDGLVIPLGWLCTRIILDALFLTASLNISLG